MDEDKLRNRIPIFRFLNKHKWRIVLPFLVYAIYFYFPIYTVNRPVGVISHLSVTSTQNASLDDLSQEVTTISEGIQSDESILELIKKYRLFAAERRAGMSNSELIDEMRVSMVVGPDFQSPPGAVGVFILVNLRNEGPDKAKALTDEIIGRFRSRTDFTVTNAPMPPTPVVSIPVTTRILFQLLLVFPALFSSLLLIFIWEIPNLFYSRKTQEMVFDPIRADWNEDLLEAKTHGTVMDGVAVNVQYSFAFIGAMLARSPVGELFETVGKLAR